RRNRSERPHDVVDPSRAEPFLLDQEPGAALAEEILRGYAHVAVGHLAVRRPATAAVPESRHRLDLDSGGVGGNDDLTRAASRFGVGLGDGHDDPEARALRA